MSSLDSSPANLVGFLQPRSSGSTMNGAKFGFDERVYRAICYPLLGISVVVVLLRLYTRKVITRMMRLDDHFIILALAFCAFSTASVEIQFIGKTPGKQDSAEGFLAKLYFTFVSGLVTYALSGLFIKLSVLFFYRDFLTFGKYHRIAWYLVLVLIIGYTVPCVLLTIFFCIPIQAAWTPSLKKSAKCIDFPSLNIAQGLLNVATDLIILTLALPIALRLRVSLKQKATVGLIFVVGSSTAVISFFRLGTLTDLFNLGNGPGTALSPSSPISAIIWSLVEINIGIFCASVITLRPLARKVFRSKSEEDEDFGSFTRKAINEPLEWK